ncbi:MAG: YegS/Rv2252/BmrU family lipid kinase [Parcubacteria group bacterium]|nr:YegS/Rv2252/BmrU family lipid kinase [Parcubacteria group bacterium]
MQKILIIYNPVAGAKKFVNARQIIQKILNDKDYLYEWFETVPEKEQPLDQFANKDFDRIIVVGGDGTIRDVVGFMIKNKIKTPLGIIAQGSANLLALSLNIPYLSIQKALNFALKEKSQPLDVMLVNQKHIGVIAAGLGYDSTIIKGATRRLKRRYGLFAYIISFLRTFFSFRSEPCNLVIDGQRHYALGKLVGVINVLSWGQIKTGTHISPQDGILNIAVFNPRSIFSLIKISLNFLFKKKANMPKLKTFTGKKISAKFKKKKWIQIDGEIFRGRNLQVEVVPNAVNVIYNRKF